MYPNPNGTNNNNNPYNQPYGSYGAPGPSAPPPDQQSNQPGPGYPPIAGQMPIAGMAAGPNSGYPNQNPGYPNSVPIPGQQPQMGTAPGIQPPQYPPNNNPSPYSTQNFQQPGHNYPGPSMHQTTYPTTNHNQFQNQSSSSHNNIGIGDGHGCFCRPD